MLRVADTLRARVNDGTASDLDRFVLEALTASDEQLRSIYQRVQNQAQADREPD